jgi:hypothetical protein
MPEDAHHAEFADDRQRALDDTRGAESASGGPAQPDGLVDAPGNPRVTNRPPVWTISP